MQISDLDYPLPPGRIAAQPADPRDSARLMVARRDTGRLEHHNVRDLPELGLLTAGDLMVVNQTRVLPAYLTATRAATGGKVTGLYLETTASGQWAVLLEARGKLRVGETLRFANGQAAELIADLGAGRWALRTEADLHAVGSTPLPPYIRKLRDVNPNDAQRYNTVYAADDGSVAAPTAGLHFTPGLLDRLAAMGVRRAAVTLHVGLGTFAPIRTETLADHAMHRERVTVPRATLELLRQTRAAGGRILTVGTTTIRALESLPDDWQSLGGDFTADTDLFIYPDAPRLRGFRFADVVMTNFHLPRSTLLAMIAALPGVGIDRLKQWYAVAVDEGYRFYSYGDAMVLA